MEVSVDLAKAAAAGIKPGDVRRAAATLLSGLRVGSLFEDQKIFDVQVWSTPETRNSISSVRDLVFDGPTGEYIRLGDVADVHVRSTQPSIKHQDISRYVDVVANVNGRGAGDVRRDLEVGMAKLTFPFEYHAEILNDFGHQDDAHRRLWGFGVAVVIGIFLLLQAAFSSWRLAIAAFAMVPVALVGGLVTARIYGRPVSIATVAGMLAVLALSVRHIVAMIDRLQFLRRSENLSKAQAVERAASERVGPVVTSTLLTLALVLPVLFVGDTAGTELLFPMTIVVIGGLISSAITVLFLVPAIYQAFGPEHLDTGPDLAKAFEEADLLMAEAGPSGF